MKPDLSDDETLALARLLKCAIEDDPYPLSPRVLTLKAILAKIEPPPAVVINPYPAPRPGDQPRAAVLARKRRRAR